MPLSVRECTPVRALGSSMECLVVLLRPQPHPEGLRCLVLSGCLADGATPRPGRLLPIPRVKRLVVSEGRALKMSVWQCPPHDTLDGVLSSVHVSNILQAIVMLLLPGT